MGPRPWDADRELSAGQAAEAIASQFPAVDVTELRLLGAGWEFDAWATPDDWVFRFPRRRSLVTVFDREAALLDVVRPVLTRVVAIPHPELRGRPCPAFPYPFAGHRMLPGPAADAAEAPRTTALATDLARVLGRLHGIRAETARRAGCTEDRDGCEAWYRDTIGYTAGAEPTAPAIEEALRWLADDPTVPPEHPGPPQLVHNDLCPEHLLVDRSSGRLTGVLDWTDAALADPMLDFTVFAAWRGWAFVEALLRAYPFPVDASAIRRLEFLARVQTVHWWWDAVQRHGDVAKHEAWVENAFGRIP